MFGLTNTFAGKVCFCIGLGTATYWYISPAPIQMAEESAPQRIQHFSQLAAPAPISAEYREEPSAPSGGLFQQIAENLSASSEATSAPEAASTDGEANTEEKKEEVAATDENEVIAQGAVPQLAYMGQPYSDVEAPTQQNQDGRNPADIPLVGNLQAMQQQNHSNYYTGSGSSGSIAQSGSSITQADLEALKSSMKAAFPSQKISIKGANVCKLDNNLNLTGCGADSNSSFTLHSLRWSMDQGLKTDVTLVSRVNDGKVEMDLAFTLQKVTSQQASEEVVAYTLKTKQITAETEVKNQKRIRTIVLKFNDLVHANETLSQVTATLSFEETSNGLQLMSGSELSFVRSGFSTLEKDWNPSDANNLAAPGDRVIMPFQMPVSISVEKSP